MSNRFTYKDFSCEVDIFKNGKDVILRFYEASNCKINRNLYKDHLRGAY